MRLVFVGTSQFAVPCLEAVIASPHDVLAVVTQPDKPKGRGQQMQLTPVKEIALAHSIPVLQPERISEAAAVAEIMSYGPVGAMVVVAYGQKIPSELLAWPAHGAINAHGSILPKYRGAAPIQHALIAGESTTGVTTMRIDERFDTGDILLQESVQIEPEENAGELSERLSLLGASLLVRTLDGLEQGTIAPIAQDPELASPARSLARDAGIIDWSRSASDIVNLTRGCTPRPGAFTRLNGVQIKVWRALVATPPCSEGQPNADPGTVVVISDDGIAVAAGEGCVTLVEVQPESRKQMSAADFARGGKVAVGDRFDVFFEMPAAP